MTWRDLIAACMNVPNDKQDKPVILMTDDGSIAVGSVNVAHDDSMEEDSITTGDFFLQAEEPSE